LTFLIDFDLLSFGGFMRAWFYVSAMLMLMFCAACSPKVVPIRTVAIMPANNSAATTFREVAILPFDGREGLATSSELEAMLTSIKVGEQPYFRLADRTQLQNIISEIKLSHSGMLTDDAIIKIGRLAGVKGIYTGVVTMNEISSDPYTEKRPYTVCGAYSTITSNTKRSSVSTPVCTSWIQKYNIVNCTRKAASFGYSVKLTEVESGQVVYAADFSSSSADAACNDRRAVKSNAELRRQAKDDVKAKFRRDVAPFETYLTINIMGENEGIHGGRPQELFERGIEYAEAGRLDRGCELWQEALAMAPGAVPLIYNMGICYEVRNELERARDMYRKADRALGKPDSLINSALGRIGEAIERERKLRQQQSERQQKMQPARRVGSNQQF